MYMTALFRMMLYAIMRQMMLRSVVAIVLGVASPAEAGPPADPSGTWLTADGRARVRLERCGAGQDRICGYIVWMKDAADARGQAYRDTYNPDPDKRARPLLGHQFIMGARPAADGFDGEVYNAEDGKSYSVLIWREAPDRLRVKGCLLKLFCQTQTWQQTNDVLPGQLVGLTGDLNGPKPDKEWAAAPRPKPVPAKAR
jgi:uncharacterized protein (DUF2147 family)